MYHSRLGNLYLFVLAQTILVKYSSNVRSKFWCTGCMCAAWERGGKRRSKFRPNDTQDQVFARTAVFIYNLQHVAHVGLTHICSRVNVQKFVFKEEQSWPQRSLPEPLRQLAWDGKKVASWHKHNNSMNKTLQQKQQSLHDPKITSNTLTHQGQKGRPTCASWDFQINHR